MTQPAFLMLRIFQSLFCLLLLCACVPLAAQQASLGGTFTDPSGIPIAFETVLLQDSTGKLLSGTLTDDQGNFMFQHLGAGTYILKTQSLGFQIERKVPISENGTFYVVLQLAPFILVPSPIQPQQVIDLIWTLDGDIPRRQIREMGMDRNPLSLLAALRSDLMQVEGTAGLRVRGASAASTGIYVDGQKLRGALELPFNSIENIRLYVGSIPAEYGDATGGIIEIQTKRVQYPTWQSMSYQDAVLHLVY